MLVKHFLIVFVLPITLLTHLAVNAQISSEDDFVAALVSGPIEKTASSLLQEHHDLISRSLFDKLISKAEQMPEASAPKSWQLLDIAKETANQLGDKKLVALSLYKTGLLHFRKGNVPQAKLSYLESKQLLEGIGTPSDLVLLLGSLANVCLYQDSLKEGVFTAKYFSFECPQRRGKTSHWSNSIWRRSLMGESRRHRKSGRTLR
jgi:hypothetical protein